ELGLAERTLVFFFSDNGATPRGSNKPLRGHKGTLWEGGHRVPAIAWWPGKIAPGRTTNELAAGFDLMPTMLELAGASVPEGHELDGVSLAPVLLRGEQLAPRKLFWGFQNRVAMRDGQWKYIRGEKELGGKPGLFRLDRDLSEQENLAGRYPEKVREMEAATAAWLEEMKRTATPQPSMQAKQ
ncbi:MAG: sulfatase-like hydrolase/transferase, partial [Thermoleophilia bacterium]|nr:sulfatase-like hydrolase/transferase [Thermoleophilia bacterium]